MAYEVTVTEGHPTGVFRRAGTVFTASEPVILEEIADAIRNERWLSIKEVGGTFEQKVYSTPVAALVAMAEDDPALVDKMLEAERAGKARKSLISRLEELAGEEETEDEGE